jgi:hypothetical protein
LYRKAFAAAAGWLRETLRGTALKAFEHETWLWFFAGIVRQRWADTRAHGSAQPATAK